MSAATSTAAAAAAAAAADAAAAAARAKAVRQSAYDVFAGPDRLHRDGIVCTNPGATVQHDTSLPASPPPPEIAAMASAPVAATATAADATMPTTAAPPHDRVLIPCAGPEAGGAT